MRENGCQLIDLFFCFRKHLMRTHNAQMLSFMLRADEIKCTLKCASKVHKGSEGGGVGGGGVFPVSRCLFVARFTLHVIMQIQSCCCALWAKTHHRDLFLKQSRSYFGILFIIRNKESLLFTLCRTHTYQERGRKERASE